MWNSRFVLVLIFCGLIAACAKQPAADLESPSPDKVANPVEMPAEMPTEPVAKAPDTGDIQLLSVVLKTTKANSTPESVWIGMEVHNPTDATVEICKYQTLLEEQLSSGNMLEVVTASGEALAYQGIMRKRPEPSRERGDYVALKPGEKTSGKVDVADSYYFRPGRYRVRFKGNQFVNDLPDSEWLDIDVDAVKAQ